MQMVANLALEPWLRPRDVCTIARHRWTAQCQLGIHGLLVRVGLPRAIAAEASCTWRQMVDRLAQGCLRRLLHAKDRLQNPMTVCGAHGWSGALALRHVVVVCIVGLDRSKSSLWVVSRAQVHLQKQMAVMQASAQMLRRPARLVLGPNGVTALQVCRSSENVGSFPKVAMAEHHARCP